jgi:hypothetical protein
VGVAANAASRGQRRAVLLGVLLLVHMLLVLLLLLQVHLLLLAHLIVHLLLLPVCGKGLLDAGMRDLVATH